VYGEMKSDRQVANKQLQNNNDNKI